MEWRLRRVVPAAVVTTHAKPHAQQQLASDLGVERAAMGQRCRPQSLGEVQQGIPQPRRWPDSCELQLYKRGYTYLVRIPKFYVPDRVIPVQQYKHGVGSPPRGARSGGHYSC